MPAHAEIYDPYGGGFVPYSYTDDTGRKVDLLAFQVQTKLPGTGWLLGMGTAPIRIIESNTFIQALRIIQMLDSPKICVQASKAFSGWMQQELCTDGLGTMITVGDETSTTPIDTMTVRLKDCVYNDNLVAKASIGFFYNGNGRSYQWQDPVTALTCGQKLTFGIRAIPGIYHSWVEALDLSVKRNDSCASCTSSSPLPVSAPVTVRAPVTGGTLRTVVPQ
jgi:hypothetical protein